MKTKPSNKNILIYRLGSMGDTIMALPCFNKIREDNPNANITLLTNKPVGTKAAPVESILGGGFSFKTVLYYPIKTRNIFLVGALLYKIRSLKIDDVIYLAAARSKKTIKRDKLFFRAAGIKTIIGLPIANEDLEISLDHDTGEYEWEAKRLARRISKTGTDFLANNYYWDLHLTDLEHHEATPLLATFSNSSDIITISIGTKLQSNDWGIDNWIALVKALKLRLINWKLVLIGAAEEIGLANLCLEAWGGDGINLCGQIPPRVSAAVLEQSRIFVGHDSGPMHLAACVGTPCVAIFSGRNLPRQWYPRGSNHRILQNLPECSGCGLETCIEQQKKCILSITVEEVKNAVFDLLGNSASTDIIDLREDQLNSYKAMREKSLTVSKPFIK